MLASRMVSDEEWDRRLAAALAKLDQGTREDFDERAGIMEFDGGRGRRAAELIAWDIVMGDKTPPAAGRPAK